MTGSHSSGHRQNRKQAMKDIKDKKRRKVSAKNTPEKTGSGRNNSDRYRSDRTGSGSGSDRDSSGRGMAAWHYIQNILLVLLPALIMFSLLYSAISPPGRKDRSQTADTEADTTPPQITLTRDKGYFVRSGELYEEEGYAAYDNHDGDITKKVEVSVNGDTVRYRVKDEAGNITVRFRTIPRLDADYIP